MDNINEHFLCTQQSLHSDWEDIEKPSQDRPSDSEETNLFETDDDTKIKPEIELKEETEGFVYKADFRGHLQLVNLDHDIPNQCDTTEKNQLGEELTTINSNYSSNYSQESVTDKPKEGDRKTGVYDMQESREDWPTSEDRQQVTVTWGREGIQLYRQLKNATDNCVNNKLCIKEEPSENSSQENNYSHSLPEIYDYSSDSTWEPQGDNFSQVPDLTNQNINGKSVLLTQAEKKRLYRMRIKEENPSMWSTIKKREAARKRETREKRRQLLYEMQKAMELSVSPNCPDAVNQKLYLEALKERYPELWNQLTSALPETQIKSEPTFDERSAKSKRNTPKPVRMYKDVIEAQKKRLYRQRIKEERPEMYERQKARDAYSRSVQRLVLKKKQSLDRFNLESLHPSEVEKKLTYLQNLQIETYQLLSSKNVHSDSSRDTNTLNSITTEPHTTTVDDVETLSPTKTAVDPNFSRLNTTNIENHPSEICDNKHLESCYGISSPAKHSSDNGISDKTKEIPKVNGNTFPAACTTQSDILWYWNDVKATKDEKEHLPPPPPPPPLVTIRKGPQVLTEEERMQKILKERMQLKEKRKRYRMSMTPQRRSEFLEIERERLKLYRLKKKAAEAVANEMLCVNR